jgi:hypothetical protein
MQRLYPSVTAMSAYRATSALGGFSPLTDRACEIDRADLLTMLRRDAFDGELHVDDDSRGWIEFRRHAPDNEPPFVKSVLTKTIYVGLWRGANDDDPEVIVDDGGHQGHPWLTFYMGKHPELASMFRARLLADVKRRWPDARTVPIMPDGALPLSNDLTWTGKSYVVRASGLAATANPAALSKF